jgi:hypothetical protein
VRQLCANGFHTRFQSRSSWTILQLLARENPAVAGLSMDGAYRDRTGDLRLASREAGARDALAGSMCSPAGGGVRVVKVADPAARPRQQDTLGMVNPLAPRICVATGGRRAPKPGVAGSSPAAPVGQSRCLCELFQNRRLERCLWCARFVARDPRSSAVKMGQARRATCALAPIRSSAMAKSVEEYNKMKAALAMRVRADLRCLR